MVLGIVPKAFSKSDFPSDNFPSGNFPNEQFPKRQLSKGLVMPSKVLRAAIGG